MGKAKKGKKKKVAPGDAEELERNAKRLELCRELDLGDFNAGKQRMAWREKMMNLNLPIIKEDLEVAWRTFDRALDSKNYSISILLDTLESAEEQKRRADFTHIEQIDGLLEVYKEKLQENERTFQDRIQKALKSTEDYVEKLENQQGKKEIYLRTVIFSGKNEAQESLGYLRAKNLSKVDTCKKDNENVRRIALTILKRRLRNYSEEHIAILRGYEENTKDRRKEFEKIRIKDESDRRIIARNQNRIENLYLSIQELKNEISKYRKEAEKEIADCRFERDYYRSAYFSFQNHLRSEQILDRERLKIATMEYSETEEYLKSRLRKMEQIFSMINLCQKYETYNEKVLLYPLSTVTDENNCKDFSKEMIFDTLRANRQDLLNIQKLFHKFSKVKAEIIELRCNLSELHEESNNLKSLLQGYMNKMSG